MKTRKPNSPIAAFPSCMTVADTVREGVYVVDHSRMITYWNSGAEAITGYLSEEVVGSYCYDNILQHVDETGNELCLNGCPLSKTMEDGQLREARVYLHHRNGHRVPVDVRTALLLDDSGETVGAVETFTDIKEKEELARRIAELENAALIDHLTGIPNRLYLDQFLSARLHELKRYGWSFGLIMVDIDHFKKFNDCHGHLVGDEVLRLVAQTMASNLRPFDVVARWGGEEFAAVVVNVDDAKLVELAERLRALVEKSDVWVNGGQLSVTISSGVSMALPDDTPETLIDRTDKLLYRSKHDGRNRVTRFTHAIDS